MRVLADRKWGGASAVTLFSVVALVGGLMAATAAAHAGQVEPQPEVALWNPSHRSLVNSGQRFQRGLDREAPVEC